MRLTWTKTKFTITQLVPDADDVTLEGVQAKRDDIQDSFNQRTLAKELFTASQQLLNGRAEPATVVVNAREALEVYRRGKVAADTAPKRLTPGWMRAQVLCATRLRRVYRAVSSWTVRPRATTRQLVRLRSARSH